MARRTDWLPGSMELKLAMAKAWLLILQTKAAVWNILAAAVQELTEKTANAENWLSRDLSPDRTKTITAECKAAFKDLTAFMRDFKRRYFLVPPLTGADLISLGLKPQDRVPTQGEIPTAQPEADLTFPGVHLIELKNIRPVSGGQSSRNSDGSEFGARVYYGLSGTPTTSHKFRITEPPTSGSDLPYSEWVSKKKILFDFDGESGNTAYFCLRYENSKGAPGPFGPILKAVIP
ncbi:MAG: hypothetical protein LBG05_00315 [Treponema sp.]|jgi:hypothetical protein|nr:hypothetical protein [Treponema sp.]